MSYKKEEREEMKEETHDIEDEKQDEEDELDELDREEDEANWTIRIGMVWWCTKNLKCSKIGYKNWNAQSSIVFDVEEQTRR